MNISKSTILSLVTISTMSFAADYTVTDNSWNLLGISPNGSSIDVGSWSDQTSIIWSFKNSNWKSSKNGLTTVNPGEGFWVKTNAGVTSLKSDSTMTDTQYKHQFAEGENYPSYYAQEDKIVLKDVMTRYFNVSEKGILSYGLEDAAKAAGHVCPSITGAFLMTKEALSAIKNEYEANPNPTETSTYDYEDNILYRGGIKVTMAGADGVGNAANAIANVISFITGAKMASGFSGGPDFPFANRQNLFVYDNDLQFDPVNGIEAIFTSMKATYIEIDENGNETGATTYDECKGTWGKCKETTTCDFSVKVSYKFKSPDIIGTDAAATWDVKINNILDNSDKAITIEKVDNPEALCS